jgi:ribonucleotide reductase beta subunit family protein with ferritin-like domain
MNDVNTIDTIDTIKNDDVFIEPLLDKKNFRFTIKPIDQNYQLLWQLYKKQQESYWTSEEIDFSKDYDDFVTLTDNEQHFIEMVLAFFASADGIVNFNLRERFLQEIQIVEAQVAYGFQLTMESIHGEIYSDMLINIVKDVDRRIKLFGAIENIPSIKKMSQWALKWVSSESSFQQRLVAFAIVEAVFFSSAFASIFWLKKQRGAGKLFLEGLIKSNRFISRDEALHATFACAMYHHIVNKVDEKIINEMFYEAIIISEEFVNDAINVKLLGMNVELMNEYVKYVADRLLVMLGYKKLFNATNHFDFMETIGLHSKDNFFETRPDAYQKAHNEDNKEKWTFNIIEDF